MAVRPRRPEGLLGRAHGFCGEQSWGWGSEGRILDETELVTDEEWQGSRGITFGEQVPAKWAAIRKKLQHQRNDELARQLKYSDADEHLIRAAKCLKCQTCSRCSKPGTRRPARPATLMDLGEALAMDVIHFDDSTGNKVKALSICIGPLGQVTPGSSSSIWTAGSRMSSSAWRATLGAHPEQCAWARSTGGAAQFQLESYLGEDLQARGDPAE